MIFNTPQEFADWVDLIKLHLVDIITDELVPATITPNEQLPVIRGRSVIDRDGDKWAGRLRSPRHKVTTGGETVDWVHGFMVAYGGATYVRPSGVGVTAYRLRFLIDGYCEIYSRSDTDNSEKLFNAEVLRIGYRLMNKKPFGVPGVSQVFGWDERRGIAELGFSLVHESLADVFMDTDEIQIDYQ